MSPRAVAAGLIAVLAALPAACGGHSKRAATKASSSPAATTGGDEAAPRPLRFTPCRGVPGMRCARLVVPLDRHGRRPGTLSLRVGVSAARRPPGGDVVVLSGGPGQPGVALSGPVRARLRAALRGRRLVMLDQRGTGGGALRCPELQRAMGTSDLAVPPASAVTSCARRIGPKREDFTTADTVADLDALRAALGDRRWAIGGVSYGSFVAERYALAHPDRVTALFLDSVVPHAGVDALAPGDLRPVVRVLRLACRRAQRCPGDPGADLRAVLRRYGGGPRLADTVTALSIGTPRLEGFIAALHAARTGDRRPLKTLERAVHRAQQAPAIFLSQGLHAATLCAESRFPWAPGDPVDRRAALARDAALHRADPLFDPVIGARNGFVTQCTHWPPEPAPPRVPAQLPDVPTLLLAGDEDLSTPLEWTRSEAAVAPGGKLVVVHGSGHSTLLHDPKGCAPRALARLLDDRPLPASC